jgi:hypothetical protein
MAALAFKKFKVAYTNLEGERVNEEPRLMISADGEAKSLVIGQWQVLAEVPYEAPDAELWAKARARAVTLKA